ncbi:hypothetical protein ACWF94_40685, partial [Streptomyces sp. NPDC055078]
PRGRGAPAGPRFARRAGPAPAGSGVSGTDPRTVLGQGERHRPTTGTRSGTAAGVRSKLA